ncbi:hypothetical protein K2Q08_02890 [Patescibacteria group bacterium]|nr:hypothetical protein [Patescibacteria group bacterium]
MDSLEFSSILIVDAELKILHCRMFCAIEPVVVGEPHFKGIQNGLAEWALDAYTNEHR